jgi:hypothetical protein
MVRRPSQDLGESLVIGRRESITILAPSADVWRIAVQERTLLRFLNQPSEVERGNSRLYPIKSAVQKSDLPDRQFRRPPLTDAVISLSVATANATTPPGPAHILNSQEAKGEFYNLILFDGRAECYSDPGFEHSKIVLVRAERPNQFDQLIRVVFDGEPKASDCRISVIDPKDPVRVYAHQGQCNRRRPTEWFPKFAYVFDQRD